MHDSVPLKRKAEVTTNSYSKCVYGIGIVILVGRANICPFLKCPHQNQMLIALLDRQLFDCALESNEFTRSIPIAYKF